MALRAVGSVDLQGQSDDELRPASRSYFPALDGLRGLAFLMVFGVHYMSLPWGWTGVDVFFVLSGFLITGILYDTQDDPHGARNFYVRRTLRIFPLYYGLMLLLVVTYPLLRWEWTWAWLVWPAYLGNFVCGLHPFTPQSPLQMLADFQPLSARIPRFQLLLGHFWSLCVEEQFYLIWPWVVFWVRDRRKLIYICVACVVICPAMRLVGNHVLPQWMLQQAVLCRWTPFRVDALLLGGLVALIRRGPMRDRLVPVARAVFGVLAAVGVCWAILNHSALRHFTAFQYPDWHFTWGLVFFDFLSASVIVLALEPRSATYLIFNLAPLRWVGRISYGAYVFHDIYHLQIAAVVRYFFGGGRYETAAIALVFTLVVSWMSFELYETPFIRMKRKWAQDSVATLPA